jgi:trk system potassium uptake protein
MKQALNSFINPIVLVALGFITTSLMGAFLLMQSWATQNGLTTSFIDSWFTASSALFVTGLTVVETGLHWSFAGKLILLILIQIGALGFVVIGGYLAYLVGIRFYFKDRQMLSDNLGSLNRPQIIKTLKRIVRYFFIIEIIGAAFLSFVFFSNHHSLLQSIEYGTFHALSAFANAGFDILGNRNSLNMLIDYPYALEILGLLIIVGGIGFPVWLDIVDKIKDYKKHKISVYTKIVISVSIFLLVLGFLVFSLFDWRNRDATENNTNHLRESLFMSISARTAGFSVYDITEKSKPSLAVLASLMFIGGSPASTAGGIKTVTAFIIFVFMVGILQGKTAPVIFKRQIDSQLLFRAIVIAFFSLTLIVGGTIFLEFFDNPPIFRALFEIVSALGTVGLSLNLTHQLSWMSKLMLIFLMFMGRIGLYVFLYGFFIKRNHTKITRNYPEANLCV